MVSLYIFGNLYLMPGQIGDKWMLITISTLNLLHHMKYMKETQTYTNI